MGDSEDEGESQSAAAEGGADLFPTAPLQPEPEPPPPPPGPPISYEPSCAHCMEPEFRIFWGCVWCFGTGFGMAEAGRKSLEERMRLKQIFEACDDRNRLLELLHSATSPLPL